MQRGERPRRFTELGDVATRAVATRAMAPGAVATRAVAISIVAIAVIATVVVGARPALADCGLHHSPNDGLHDSPDDDLHNTLHVTLHDDFDALLAEYVHEGLVRYEQWAASGDGVERLTAYVDRLEAVTPGALERDARLAYWINLYNSATLELVLAHYPVASIRKIGGFLRSPWKRKVVTVEGEELTLDNIEHDIIRPRFGDARIHFALNCASNGCPPLAARAFRGRELDAQLDAVCRGALNDVGWVEVDGDRLILTKIFDWYRSDFVDDAGSVEAFIGRFRADDAELFVVPGKLKLKYRGYDWDLNITGAR